VVELHEEAHAARQQDRRAVGAVEAQAPLHVAGAVAAQEPGHPGGEAVDDLAAVGLEGGEVDLRRLAGQPAGAQRADLVQRGGELDERLGRDAPHVQARAAQAALGPAAVDHHDLPAELRRTGGRDVAAGPGADDEDVDVLGDLADDHQRSSPRRRPGSSTRRATSETKAASVSPSSRRWSPEQAMGGSAG
jgi:hypothetical protein